MNYVLFDDQSHTSLLPLTFTRPVADIRIGILTIREKWEKYLQTTCSVLTQEYLQAKFPYVKAEDTVFINASLLPGKELVERVLSLTASEVLLQEDFILAARVSASNINHFTDLESYSFRYKSSFETPCISIRQPWNIFQHNGIALSADYELLTAGRTSARLSATNTVIGNAVFIEESASVECSILNSSTGPIYIGKGAEVMEGSMIRGPFSLGGHASVKMGCKVYGPTTVGPHSRVGGEISNSVIFGYSNKGHDGFLGNSVLGEWCNLGADTNNSNLKNNYSNVKVWSYVEKDYVDTGLQFCGLIMGDHSKSGINTMFNTGTVVGVSSNVYGSGFPPKFIPSFSWGGGEDSAPYKLEQALEVAGRVLERRNKKLDEADKDILMHLFRHTHAG